MRSSTLAYGMTIADWRLPAEDIVFEFLSSSVQFGVSPSGDGFEYRVSASMSGVALPGDRGAPLCAIPLHPDTTASLSFRLNPGQ